jgi:hypothetical protein
VPKRPTIIPKMTQPIISNTAQCRTHQKWLRTERRSPYKPDLLWKALRPVQRRRAARTDGNDLLSASGGIHIPALGADQDGQCEPERHAVPVAPDDLP